MSNTFFRILCLFDLILYVPENNFSVTDPTGLNQYEARMMCFAQGHNAVTLVKLEPATPWF